MILIGSGVFYASSGLIHLISLSLTVIITYYFSNQTRLGRDPGKIPAIGIVLISLQLVLAKYGVRFFTDVPVSITPIDKFFNVFVMPVGVSFYTLQAISLLADVKANRYKGSLRLKDIALFLSFFPQTISGPIHRGNELIPQFSFQSKVGVAKLVTGVKAMLWGYFCKLIVADKIGILISPIFDSWHQSNGLSLAVSMGLYSFQIYFDFWGYSLIAIGVGQLLGFDINENFKSPYSVSSFRKFWHRWHITLSVWMRDYVYIPLGGRNSDGYLRFVLSVTMTFVISGIWHGMTVNFILWGAVHALLYLIEDFIERSPFFNSEIWVKAGKSVLARLAKRFVFFGAISITWLIFRTDNPMEMWGILSKTLNVYQWRLEGLYFSMNSITEITFLGYVLFGILYSKTNHRVMFTRNMPLRLTERLLDFLLVCFILISIILFGDIGEQRFLYFNF